MQVECYKTLIYKQRRAKRLRAGHLVPRAAPRESFRLFRAALLSNSGRSLLLLLTTQASPAPTRPRGCRRACRPGTSLPLGVGEALSHGLKPNLILRGWGEPGCPEAGREMGKISYNVEIPSGENFG